MSASTRRTKRKNAQLDENISPNKTSTASKLAKLKSANDDDHDEKDNEAVIKNQRRYWLMKSEPESRIENGHEMKFSFDDLKANKDQITCWDGVRNFEARNHMRSMRVGDQAFFYHSNCKNPGIVGVVRVCKEAYIDHTQFDSKDAHYDPKSDPANPKWFMVDVKYERDLERFVPLSEMKAIHLEHKKPNKNGPLRNLSLFTRSRLSVQSLSEEEWNFLIDLATK